MRGVDIWFREASQGGIVAQPFSQLPCDYFFDVLIEVDGKEHHLGTLQAGPNMAPLFFFHEVIQIPREIRRRLEETGAKSVKVILRANPAAAEHTINMYEVWAGPDIVREVPLEK